MSLIQRGILEAMLNLEAFEKDGLSAGFLFPKEFMGFQGHFKSNPVLPGICKIQAVVAMYEKFHHRIFRLIEVSQAKFFLPVTCLQKIMIQCHSKKNLEDSLIVKALVKREEETTAMLQLILQVQT